MSTVDSTPKRKLSFAVKTRRIRCLSSARSMYYRQWPRIALDGKWLKDAGFDVGDWARIVVQEGTLLITCEKLPEKERRHPAPGNTLPRGCT